MNNAEIEETVGEDPDLSALPETEMPERFADLPGGPEGANTSHGTFPS